MGRVDSGYHPSGRTTSSNMDGQSIHRSNTAPTRHRQPKNTSSEKPNPTSNPKPLRPSSEKRSTTQRKTPPTELRRRKSISSEEENSTKSRSRHGHNSKPSSRRTSCTIVDPSRPARHYRIKSSQTVPNMHSGDIDDVLALHFRSCTLFQNPGAYRAESLPASPDTDFRPSTAMYSQRGTTSIADTDLISPALSAMPTIAADDDSPFSLPRRASTSPTPPPTTMHWTSPHTRRREYAKIDKANSGLRALLRKLVPRCVSGPPPQRFYEKDMDDVGSVRRYRISLDGEEAETEVDEKRRMLARGERKRRGWCF